MDARRSRRRATPADELAAGGDVIQIGDASANVEAIQPGTDGQDVIVAERIDD
jgi:hypothetical protein